jgi:hypothetical protein
MRKGESGYLIVLTFVVIGVTWASTTQADSSPLSAPRISDSSIVVVEHEVVEQLPAGCLDAMLQGFREADCVVIGESTSCGILVPGRKERTRCKASINLIIDGANPKVSLFGTNCHPIAITQDTVHRGGDPRKLEAIGQWCFTPSGNFLDADGTCVVDTASGSILAVGNFQGSIELDSRMTMIRAIHNESVM